MNKRNVIGGIRKESWMASAVLICIVLVAFFGLNRLKPPRALPENIPLTEFSALRAVKHLEMITSKPHCLGSAAHDEVRDYLLDKWKEMGFAPEIQETTLVNGRWIANVQNIVVRVKGTGSGKALMLSTHYDSTESSYGAADAGAGIAALLETARALKAGTPLKNDIIFLVADGEENGMLGARAFVLEHPWAKDIGLALNFDARGTGGPALMFETSRGNARLIKEFSKASPYPFANSLAVTIYRLMPNDSDLTVFIAAGMQGLNFAFVDDPLDYHSPMDNLAHLDLNSLQHHGSYALALARHFGDIGIPERISGDAVYFNILGPILVRYSTTAAAILAILAVVLLVLAGAAGFKRRLLQAKNLLWAFLYLISTLVMTPALFFLFWKIIGLSHGTWLPSGDYRFNPFYLLALVFLALAVFFFLFFLFRKRAGWPNMGFVAAFVGVILSCGLVIYLPGASYLTGWPFLFLTTVLFFFFLSKKESLMSWGKAGLVVLSFAPSILIFAPLLYLFFIAMGLDLTATAGLSLLLVLLLWTMIPALELLTQNGRKGWMLVAALGFLVFAGAGALTTRFDERHPRHAEMRYLLDFDTGQAFWYTWRDAKDEWTRRFIPNPQPGYPLKKTPARDILYIHQEAPVIEAEPTAVTKLEDSEKDGIRTLRLKISSPRQVREIYIDIEKQMLYAAINGKKLIEAEAGKRGLHFRFNSPGREGFEVLLKVQGGEPLSILIREGVIGLPKIPGKYLPQPPPRVVPVLQSTILEKTFLF